MSNGVAALSYAVRPRVIGRHLGQLSLMLALLHLVPLIASVIWGEWAFSWRYLVSIVVLCGLGLAARRLPEPENIQSNEALVVVVAAFVGASLIAAFPFSAGRLGFVDAWFEAVSAVTTTGLSTAGSSKTLSPVIVFARAWMQWYGGLGIAVLSVALLMGAHAAARRLVEPEEPDNVATTARTQARQVLMVYGLLTLVGTAVLWPVAGSGFVAFEHMLAAVSTGGFSPYDSSLAALPVGGAWIVTVFTVAGAVPLLLYFFAARGRPEELLRDPEVRALAFALVLVSILVALSLHGYSGLDWGNAFRHGAILGMSAQTTSGFTSIAADSLDPVSKLLLVAAMSVGGGSGSTAGGIKLLRVLVVLRLLQHFVRRTAMPPHAADQPRLSGRPLEADDVQRVATVVMLFGVAAGLSWLAMLCYGYPPLDALFEVTSALGTVGLSTGIASPGLEAPLKVLLCADMLLGRLELLALLVLLYPRTWIGKRM